MLSLLVCLKFIGLSQILCLRSHQKQLLGQTKDTCEEIKNHSITNCLLVYYLYVCCLKKGHYPKTFVYVLWCKTEISVLLCATVVTSEWNRYWNKSHHRKLTLEKKILLLPLLLWLKPETFWSWVWCSNHWAIPAPYELCTRVCSVKYWHSLQQQQQQLQQQQQQNKNKQSIKQTSKHPSKEEEEEERKKELSLQRQLNSQNTTLTVLCQLCNCS